MEDRKVQESVFKSLIRHEKVFYQKVPTGIFISTDSYGFSLISDKDLCFNLGLCTEAAFIAPADLKDVGEKIFFSNVSFERYGKSLLKYTAESKKFDVWIDRKLISKYFGSERQNLFCKGSESLVFLVSEFSGDVLSAVMPVKVKDNIIIENGVK